MTDYRSITINVMAADELDKFRGKLTEKAGKEVSRSAAILCLVDCNGPEGIRKGVK